MPRASDGTYSKPSGTTAVFDTTIDPDAYNSLANDIASELTGSLPTDGSKGMDVAAQLKLDAGSASVPGLTFAGDLDTGIYASAANKVAVAAGGVKVAEFDSTGMVEGAWTDTASASTVDLGSVLSRNVRITGTTTITALGTVASGTYRRLRFAGALTLTHNGTSLILPGATSIVTAAGDTAEFVSLGAGNWVCVDYQKAAGGAVLDLTSATAQASTSGTSIDFSSVPAWVKRITVLFAGVSLSGTANYLIQIGTGGAATTTGYVSTGNLFDQSNGTSGGSSTAGFVIRNTGASDAMSGRMTLHKVTGNTWVSDHTMRADGTRVAAGGGILALGGTLDFVRVTTSNGSDTFDLGSINIFYE